MMKDIKNNKYRMEQGLIYNPGDISILKEQVIYQNRLRKFNKLPTFAFKAKQRYMKKNFASCGNNCYIELPLRANWGGAHLHLGDNFYANFNLTIVDDGHIYFGNNVMIGPNVTIATASHPLNVNLRSKGLQFNKDVHIGNNVWIGSGAIILPGVNIGDDSVIGAGSIVTKDIPSGVVAYGNPCKVARQINENDKKYFYKNELIDYENLKED